MLDRPSGSRLEPLAARVGMLTGVLAWLWPIGLGGKMPVGGDATQFSLGLMAFLRDAIREGRLPLWNDLWGFGFPGLAESQMGVYYPPHWLLYGLLPLEVASVASLVLHTLWGAYGANLAARRFGASEPGAALAGFAWATCGFSLIHLPHQWGSTVGAWMPWAWALAWQVARGEGTRRTPWLLSAVLAVQVLPGHFQLAFVTEVGCLALALAAGGRLIARRGAVLLAVAGMVPLAAMQLWPTYQLSRLSDSRRDFEYLSGFAASPLHFVSYAAPGLFHRSPLWRPVAWDPFHTSPEELLGYVGLVPFFLALGAIARGWRADPSIRALAVVGALTLALSLGPFAPGFGWLIKLPGFSFFRAPARWGLATNLALALLAARGFDQIATWPKVGRAAGRFALACSAVVLGVVLTFELALAGSKGDAWPAVTSTFDRVLKTFPWADQPREKAFREVMAEARRPRLDLQGQMALARADGKPSTPRPPTLEAERFAVYARELGEAGGLLLALAILGGLASRPRTFAGALLAFTLADALILARHRPFDLGPARPLVEQSPVLARLAREPRGTRTLDPARNLLMVAGVEPIWAYRTLDLPAPLDLIRLARDGLNGRTVGDATRFAGVDIRVVSRTEAPALTREILESWWDQVEPIRDPALAAWIMGADYARGPGLDEFFLVRPREPSARAWLLPAEGLTQANGMRDPSVILGAFRRATPLSLQSSRPERAEVAAEVAAGPSSMVVLSSTFDPEWQAWWEGPSGERRPSEVVKVLGGWQGVVAPEPGRWTLHLEYPGRAAKIGLAVSVVAWLGWLAAWLRLGSGRGVASVSGGFGDTPPPRPFPAKGEGVRKDLSLRSPRP